MTKAAVSPPYDELRERLKSPRFQVPAWMAMLLFLTAATATLWSVLSGDSIIALVATGSWLLLGVAVVIVENLVADALRTTSSKEGNND